MEIREIKEIELDQLLGLYKHLHEKDDPLPDKKSIKKVWERIQGNEDLVYFGVFSENRLVCSCTITLVPNLTRGCRPYGVIENVVTHKAYRRSFIVFPLFLALFFIPMFLPNIKQIKDARSIFKKGIITKGEVVFIGRKKLTNVFNFKMLTNLEVFYRFNTLNGEIIETKVVTDNDWLANKLELGSSVTISYMEKKPKKSIILDFYYK